MNLTGLSRVHFGQVIARTTIDVPRTLARSSVSYFGFLFWFPILVSYSSRARFPIRPKRFPIPLEWFPIYGVSYFRFL